MRGSSAAAYPEVGLGGTDALKSFPAPPMFKE